MQLILPPAFEPKLSDPLLPVVMTVGDKLDIQFPKINCPTNATCKVDFIDFGSASVFVNGSYPLVTLCPQVNY